MLIKLTLYEKIISFIMVISIFSSCKIEKNADSQLTTTESNIEHVCIPLTDAQIIGLYNTLTTVQTRAVVLVSSLEEFKSYLNTSGCCLFYSDMEWTM